MIIKSNIKRLLRYRQSLLNFEQLGFERIFSHTIANELGMSPEQIRKDFSEFGIRGNKKGGYKIQDLLFVFDEIFSKNGNRKTIIVGMGNIGKSLASYRGFNKKDISIVAAFDIDPSKIKNKSTIPIFNMLDMPVYIRLNNIKTAIIAVPEISAKDVCNILLDNGITGILNFTPITLKVPRNVIVNNVNLSDELESIFYYINNN